MPLNPYFLQGSTQEQNLVQSLINEQLSIYGVEINYMPRSFVSDSTGVNTIDDILNEVRTSAFYNAYPLEAYIENFDGYGENPVLLSKFGINAVNELTLTISKERWDDYIGPLLKVKETEDSLKLTSRPKEGDLIHFPLGDRLFEIKYVEHQKPFYMLRENYVYTLRCELFRYEDEVIATGVDEIDDELEAIEGVDGEMDYIIGGTQLLVMVGAGTSATAVTTLLNGGIQYIDITNRGSGYVYPPRVAISSAPSGGLTGIGTASLLSGIVVCSGAADAADQKSSVVQNAYLVNPGYGYTTGPDIQFFANGAGAGAAGTAGMANGTIGIVTITGGGSGYTTTPAITFTAQNGISTTGAAATAIVSAAGTISAIHISNAGAGYTVAPTISIALPIGTGSTGNYVFNEIVTGGTSAASARVRNWDAITNQLRLYNVVGTWSAGEDITGATSGAIRTVRIIDLSNFDDGYGDNDEFETQADNILDFTEGNPFGQP